jgi:hypothetical protein
MIPTAIVLGLAGGMIPRYRWWSIPVIGVVWSIILSTSGDPSLSFAQIWVAGSLVGALNGAVGVLFTWSLIHVLRELSTWANHRWSTR